MGGGQSGQVAPPGKHAVGVTTIQFDDHSRKDPQGGPRSLQTEIWYPAGPGSEACPKNKFSDFLCRGQVQGAIAAAEEKDAIGGYREDPPLTIEELDRTFVNEARRDAPMAQGRFPLVVFSHGNGAFRASYVHLMEYLASQGFVVVAPDHCGNARYTIVNGRVVKAGGAYAATAHEERPKDVIFLINRLEAMDQGADSRFCGRVDTSKVGVAGMSFGGYTTAWVADEIKDPRVAAIVLHCPTITEVENRPVVAIPRKNPALPCLIMIGNEDAIKANYNDRTIEYFEKSEGTRCLVTIQRAGHCSFTSCELYNPAYGNGIGPSKSRTSPGEMYDPLPPAQMHDVINSYTLAWLRRHVLGDAQAQPFFSADHFGEEVAVDYREPPPTEGKDEAA